MSVQFKKNCEWFWEQGQNADMSWKQKKGKQNFTGVRDLVPTLLFLWVLELPGTAQALIPGWNGGKVGTCVLTLGQFWVATAAEIQL